MSQLKLTLTDDIVVQGSLCRIIFTNSDNGYTVFKLKPDSMKDEADAYTVVGYLGSPQVGAYLKVTGQWISNAKFGRQIQMEAYEHLRPANLEGIKLYLASGLIKGIGKAMAGRIVQHFGLSTLDVLDEEPEQLLKIKGISPAKLGQIKECWEEHKGIRELILFLQEHEIGTGLAVRIYKHYGAEALFIVKENPYRLAMDMRGIGFLTADTLAQKLGFGQEHPLRVQAGTLFILQKQIDEGHVYYPYENLVNITASQLGVNDDLIREALDLLLHEQRIVVENLTFEDEDFLGVYLAKFHHYESKIAFYLQRILNSPKSVLFTKPEAVVEQVVESLGIVLAEEQLRAVHTATKSKMMVLTGGPGTGKTTIIKAILKVFAAQKAKILLAAPTGRAAKRMGESCGHEAKTIHRLLEYSPGEDGFARNESNPLACGLLVVDEASMMDTMLAYHLLKAAPLGTTIVFVGDVHQLPSVGPGNVLKDLIASGAMPVVELVEIFRQAATSEIICNAHLINKGQVPNLESSKERLSDFYFIRNNDPAKAAEAIVDLVKNHIPRRFKLDNINDIQVLTPMHKGLVGASNLNLLLQKALNPSKVGLVRGERHYNLYDKVMQLKNNYDKDVYNGDIGRISFVDIEDKSLAVQYDDNKIVNYAWEELDEIMAAYAISIHKSQGSEYPAVVIPIMTQHYMLLQRNLIYTAVTRGKQLVILVGESKALHMAINNNRMQKRYTWLAKRLQNLG